MEGNNLKRFLRNLVIGNIIFCFTLTPAAYSNAITPEDSSIAEDTLIEDNLIIDPITQYNPENNTVEDDLTDENTALENNTTENSNTNDNNTLESSIMEDHSIIGDPEIEDNITNDGIPIDSNIQEPIRIIINREITETDVPPIIQNDRVLVPLRVISEKLGAMVEWLPETRQVTLSDPETEMKILLTIDQEEVLINENEIILDTPPIIKNDRTLVPLRFISENFSRLVKWEGDERLVRITSLNALKDIRIGNKEEYERIVMDLSEESTYHVDFEPYSKQIIIEIEDAENFIETADFSSSSHIIFDSPLVEDVLAFQQEDKTIVEINLNYGIKDIKDFDLKEPSRIVIDCDKIFEKTEKESITKGLKYTHIYRGTENGPLSIHALELDPRRSSLSVKRELAYQELTGRETVSDISERTDAIAAVNGSFFNLTDGKPVGLVYNNGMLLTEPIESWDRIVFEENGQFKIKDLQFKGGLISTDKTDYPVNGINRQRMMDEIIIYTPESGETTHTNEFGWEWVVQDNEIIDIYPDTGNSIIPQEGYIISANGNSIEMLTSLQIGDQVNVEWIFDPPFDKDERFALNGGPRLIDNGRLVEPELWEDLFKPDIINSHAPRTAIGMTSRGKVLFVTVDGRQPALSMGVTLVELAEIMKEFGAEEAVNLDGGGSTTMVIEGEVINSPSGGIQRKVADALIIVPE